MKESWNLEHEQPSKHKFGNTGLNSDQSTEYGGGYVSLCKTWNVYISLCCDFTFSQVLSSILFYDNAVPMLCLGLDKKKPHFSQSLRKKQMVPRPNYLWVL